MGVVITPPGPGAVTVGSGAGATPVQETPSTPQSASAAVNNPVVLTINGIAGQTIRITALSSAYNSAPAGGGISVVVNGVTIFQGVINNSGLVGMPLPPGGLLCQAGQNAVITLNNGGAAVSGAINAAFYYGQ
jgi:hypothetical protein